MPFSHHSHSGQFCGHATNTLEEVVQTAIKLRMSTFCMTEHIARQEIDFYPEEYKVHTMATLEQLFDDFYHEARRLQKAYAGQIQLLIGFEGEWIRDYSLGVILNLLNKYEVDLFVGSVHHVHTVPIDFDTPMYHKARDIAGGSDERIFEDYFDSQYDMLKSLQPPLIGHFDLIRLKSDDPDKSFKSWPGTWERIVRNLRFIAGYGGVLELNSSALRKGMTEAYPQAEICQVCQLLTFSVSLVLTTCRSSRVWAVASRSLVIATVSSKLDSTSVRLWRTMSCEQASPSLYTSHLPPTNPRSTIRGFPMSVGRQYPWRRSNYTLSSSKTTAPDTPATRPLDNRLL